MHKCLTVAEILSHIFEHIPVSRDLANVALVCHVFHEPALEILWRHVTLWNLLVYTIPRSVLDVFETQNWLYDRSNSVTRVARISRPPGPQEMDRFLYYTSLVRSLQMHDRHRIWSWLPPMDLDVSVFDILVSLQRSRPIFPRLRSLSLGKLPGWVHEYMEVFLTPSLRKLSYGSIAATDQTCLALMAHIRRLCPGLEELQLENYSRAQEVLDGVNQHIGSFSHLRKLEYMQSVPDTTIFHFLAELPALEDLKFSVSAAASSMQIVGPVPRQRRAGWFRSLKKLSVKSPKLRYIVPLFDMVQSAPLVQLSFSYSDNDPDRDLLDHRLVFRSLRFLTLTVGRLTVVGALLERARLPSLEELSVVYGRCEKVLGNFVLAVCASCSPSTLRYLSVHHSLSHGYETRPVLVRPIILPLLAFRRIEHLHLSINGVFEMSDETIEEIAPSWPALKHIHLGVSNIQNCSNVTAKGLISLALHCAHLELIGLPLNVTSTSVTEESGCSGVHRNHSVKELDFGYSPISTDAVKEIAAVINYIFPKLQKINGWHGPSSSDAMPPLSTLNELGETEWQNVWQEVLSYCSGEDGPSGGNGKNEVGSGPVMKNIGL
ncbi:hypothetical protein NEOLEDRAFT_1127977, partial [Neolentinus lepideus HHB14362 ss-1]